ncbi:MAG: hypothetical protein QOE65_1942 [Solirubrobacteraceae bacterium]|jgi:flavin-dependent dehydrogenase|nr:hypothetical protein [Solirubrobacteraceae bacterium]
MNVGRPYDVVVVGASVAGCAAARLLARGGARVALVERRPDPGAYKVMCTHAVLPPATRTIERLGLAPLLAARGVPRTGAELWTPYSGWLRAPGVPDGWGVTRRTLDPLLRELAAGTPGVDLLTGWTVRRILRSGGRPAGVEVEDRGHRTAALRARLVVGADGRDSAVARLAGVAGRMRPHNRFFYFAYWRGVRTPRAGAGAAIRLWLLDPDGASVFPNEDDLSVLVATYHRSRLREVRADAETAYARTFAGLPDGPDLRGAERVSKLLGKLEVPNVIRPAARPGLAFVGDAALAADPFFGVGLAFAFQSAGWLADEASAVLDSERALDAALRRYRRRFAWRLGPHHLQIADFSTGRRIRRIERLAFRRAARDPAVARALGEVLTRQRSPAHVLGPRFVSRLLAPGRPSGAPA